MNASLSNQKQKIDWKNLVTHDSKELTVLVFMASETKVMMI